MLGAAGPAVDEGGAEQPADELLGGPVLEVNLRVLVRGGAGGGGEDRASDEDGAEGVDGELAIEVDGPRLVADGAKPSLGGVGDVGKDSGTCAA